MEVEFIKVLERELKDICDDVIDLLKGLIAT
jgi:hypothetical protein